MTRRTLQDRRKRKPLQLILVLLGCASLTAYFVHHTISGKYGLETHWVLRDRARAIAYETRSLEAVRALLRRDIALLDQAAPDIVEETAASTLGFAYPADRIVAPRTAE